MTRWCVFGRVERRPWSSGKRITTGQQRCIPRSPGLIGFIITRPCTPANRGWIGQRIQWCSGLVSRACRVLYFSLFTPESGVDSAEADKVGSQRIRFCAYVRPSLSQGARHRRTTPGAHFFLLMKLFVR